MQQLRVVIGQLGLGFWGGRRGRGRGAVAILSIEWCPCLYQGNVGHPGVKWSAPKAEERGETPNQHSAVHQPANQLLIIIFFGSGRLCKLDSSFVSYT